MTSPDRSLALPASAALELERRAGTTSAAVLATWLGRYDSETSRSGMRRMARQVGRELLAHDGQPEGAPWIFLALPTEAPRAVTAYRERLAARLERRKADPADVEGLGLSSVNARLAVLRGVVDALWSLRALNGEDRDRLKRDALRNVKGEARRRQPTLDERESVRLELAAEDRAPNAASRDRALLALLSLGMRRSEVAALRWSDRADVDGLAFEFEGKGAQVREVYLDAARQAALEDWRARSGNPEVGAVLRRVNKGDRVLKDGLTGDGVYRAARALMRRAGIEGRGAHAFRRAFASTLLRKGLDVPTVARAGGWRTPAMVMRYDETKAEEEAARVRGALAGTFRRVAAAAL